MKLVVTIVQDDDADDVLEALTAAEFRATRLASTGGFLRQGNTTVIVGVPDETVDQVIQIIAQHTQNRAAGATAAPNNSYGKTNIRPDKAASPLDFLTGATPGIVTGRATVFVLNLEHFERV